MRDQIQGDHLQVSKKYRAMLMSHISPSFMSLLLFYRHGARTPANLAPLATS
jgi:hypothetical protein